jgi:hypothetical protein
LKINKKLGMYITTTLTFAVFVSLLVSPALAITGNYAPDNGKHPYVCLVGFYDQNKQWLWRTTGSLLSPTVVLTAGHGTDGATYAAVWFDEKIAYDPEHPDPHGYPNYEATNAYQGTPHTMPGFGYYLDNNGLVGFITNDAGIVVLDKPVPTNVVSQYAQLPNAGTVDTLKVGTEVTHVGYGVQYEVTPKNNGGPYGAWTGQRARFCATANLLSNKDFLSSTFMKCSENAAQGKGGTAFGDSGGPTLLGSTDIILAVTSFGPNSNCAGVGYYFRVDTPDVLKWINGLL